MPKTVEFNDQETDFITEFLIAELDREETNISPLSETSKQVMNSVINKLKE